MNYFDARIASRGMIIKRMEMQLEKLKKAQGVEMQMKNIMADKSIKPLEKQRKRRELQQNIIKIFQGRTQ